jgi:hypothetical protein
VPSSTSAHANNANDYNHNNGPRFHHSNSSHGNGNGNDDDMEIEECHCRNCDVLPSRCYRLYRSPLPPSKIDLQAIFIPNHASSIAPPSQQSSAIDSVASSSLGNGNNNSNTIQPLSSAVRRPADAHTNIRVT